MRLLEKRRSPENSVFFRRRPPPRGPLSGGQYPATPPSRNASIQ